MVRTGRPPKAAEERNRIVGISLAPAAIDALRELAALRGESQGAVIAAWVHGALQRERAKRAAPGSRAHHHAVLSHTAPIRANRRR